MLAPDALIDCVDETDLLLFPPLRSAWSRRGESTNVRLSGRNERRVVFGTMNRLTGQRLFMARRHQRSADFCVFLHLLRWQMPIGLLVLLLDEDPCHTAQRSQRLAEQLDILLVWLPVRCPELNPLELLWGRAKQAVCANRQQEDLDLLAWLFIDFLQTFTDEESLQTSGVRSKHFWLRDALSNYFCGPA